jgi:hypothetical protein
VRLPVPDCNLRQPRHDNEPPQPVLRRFPFCGDLHDETPAPDSCATLLGAFMAKDALALDFKSVGASPAIMYDAPSEKGRRVHVAPRGMPVEVVLTYGDWSKVRDAAGTLSWIASKA